MIRPVWMGFGPKFSTRNKNGARQRLIFLTQNLKKTRPDRKKTVVQLDLIQHDHVSDQARAEKSGPLVKSGQVWPEKIISDFSLTRLEPDLVRP